MAEFVSCNPGGVDVVTAYHTHIPLPDELIDSIVARAAEIVLTTIGSSSSPWMTRRQAADYLGLPPSRLEKDRSIPCPRDNGRVL